MLVESAKGFKKVIVSTVVFCNGVTISFLSSDVSMLKVCQILLDLLMFDINSTVCAYLSNMEMKCLLLSTFNC